MAANIYGIARLLYTNAEDGKDYRKEIADVYMKQGEICLSNEDYENALIDHKKALELRQQICSHWYRLVLQCQGACPSLQDGRFVEGGGLKDCCRKCDVLEECQTYYGTLCSR